MSRRVRIFGAVPGPLAPIGRADPDPLVLDLIEMDRRVVFDDVQSQIARGKPTDRRQRRVGGDNSVSLRNHQIDARIEQRLLRVQHVESCALTDFRLLANAQQGDFGGFHGRLIGDDRRFRGLQLGEAGNDADANIVALQIGGKTRLAQLLLGLPDGSIFGASLIKWNIQGARRLGRELPRSGLAQERVEIAVPPGR